MYYAAEDSGLSSVLYFNKPGISFQGYESMNKSESYHESHKIARSPQGTELAN